MGLISPMFNLWIDLFMSVMSQALCRSSTHFTYVLCRLEEDPAKSLLSRFPDFPDFPDLSDFQDFPDFLDFQDFQNFPDIANIPDFV